MAMSVESVAVEVALLARPNGLLLILAGGPNIDPFKRINPATDDLWIRLEPTGQRAQLGPRVEFVTHPSPSTTGANPLPIAHSTVLHSHTVLAFKLLEAQAVVDLVVDPGATTERRVQQVGTPIRVHRTTMLRLGQVPDTVRTIPAGATLIATSAQRCRRRRCGTTIET